MKHGLAINLVVVCLLATGCQKSANKSLAPVVGTVLVDGKPLAGADVTFVCDGAPRFSSGRTDENGEFQLSTFEPSDGAFIGVNRAAVAMPVEPSSEVEGYNSEIESVPENLSQRSKNARLAAYYTDYTTSGLEFEVVPGKNSLQLQLSSGR